MHLVLALPGVSLHRRAQVTRCRPPLFVSASMPADASPSIGASASICQCAPELEYLTLLCAALFVGACRGFSKEMSAGVFSSLVAPLFSHHGVGV